MPATLPRPITPEEWVTQVFSARAAAEGGVVRRRLNDIDSICGRDMFLSEVRRRGYKAVINGGQMVIFCNAENLQFVN